MLALIGRDAFEQRLTTTVTAAPRWAACQFADTPRAALTRGSGRRGPLER